MNIAYLQMIYFTDTNTYVAYNIQRHTREMEFRVLARDNEMDIKDTDSKVVCT